MLHRYLIALGSNRRHPCHGDPRRVLAAAITTLERDGLRLLACSRAIASAPLGPSLRRYANAAILVESDLGPEAMLDCLQDVERRFGRTRRGQRWGPRVLDLDIVLWSGGTWAVPGLTVPHPEFRKRDFVLRPALDVAAHWRDPITAQSLRQLHTRLTRPRPLP
ncbi:2-amino-4-hydroxy-6-hydroxymethyldihydropteridine diphosphokinase [Novosphingobium sp. TH158]|uniref:2-amino-4-hydroxy-6- hydroxymethyldihydropteridine diphosphokinase n=1 Tax=Novosphingobium sp. TH158 TaxID=2067455 RepID=UPI000C7957E5|nr:2-amino-4-hydroxy-6-hydroxymethyldihydropteridine diphosphokinase [Novosphingobium sp. TH158]PLK24419.1 2-amino-4-hydroxy-6-hydroxymethyldihydropteridine diphosphokinase [Novosphingobium sp. TH158]